MSFQESRDTLPVIPHLMRCSTSYRATTRYPGIPAAALVLCGPSLDPASWCGVTRSASWCGVTRAVCGTYSVMLTLFEFPGSHGVISGSSTVMPLLLSVML